MELEEAFIKVLADDVTIDASDTEACYRFSKKE